MSLSFEQKKGKTILSPSVLKNFFGGVFFFSLFFFSGGGGFRKKNNFIKDECLSCTHLWLL